MLDESEGIVFTSAGRFTFTAANGDELTGTFENTGCLGITASTSGSAITGSQTFDGGTGRFEIATGETTTSGVGIGDLFELDAVGTITY